MADPGALARVEDAAHRRVVTARVAADVDLGLRILHGDGQARYESIGRVLFQATRAAIQKVSFVTEPPPKG